MSAMLRTRDRILIRAVEPTLFDVALQISRNLYQYFRADSEIICSSDPAGRGRGNVVHLACGAKLTSCTLSSYPITVAKGQGLTIRKARGGPRSYDLQPGLGAALLRPLAQERTELVFWGFDGEGLQHAARLLPMLTGVGQPDFVIVRRECCWKGAAGVVAMGFLNHDWQVSESSYIT